MTIKTSEGEREVAGKGLAGTALGFGIGGAALSLLGGNGLNGLFGNNNQYVSKETFDLAQSNAAKDAEIALLKAGKDVDAKLLDVYNALNEKVSGVTAELNRRIEMQSEINTQQSVYNATNNAQINCIASQVAQLQGMTKLVIPNGSVCPGWGTATVTVGTTTTTTA